MKLSLPTEFSTPLVKMGDFFFFLFYVSASLSILDEVCFLFPRIIVSLPECRAKPLKALLQVFTVTWLLKHVPASLIGGCFGFFSELQTSCNLM